MTQSGVTAIPAANPAPEFYLTEIHHRDGNYFRGSLTADCRSWQVVAAIASGECERVMRVLAVNPQAGTCRDASREIAIDVLGQAIDLCNGVPDHCRDFLERHLGCAVVASAERQAA